MYIYIYHSRDTLKSAQCRYRRRAGGRACKWIRLILYCTSTAADVHNGSVRRKPSSRNMVKRTTDWYLEYV